MTVLLSLDFTPAINAFDARIAEAWRISSQEVSEATRFVKLYRRVIDEHDEMLARTVRVHSQADVERCEKLLPWALSVYLRHVKTISETEAEMEARGMAIARSSFAWGE